MRFFRVDPFACLLGALLLLTLPLKWLLAALAAATFHELCHGAAIVLLGGRIFSVGIDAGGAVMETEPMSRGRELLCALAGPAGSLFLVAFCRLFPRIAVCGFIQGAFNLLPIFPLDGGRALRCCLEGLTPKRAAIMQTGVEWGTLGALSALAAAAAFWWHLGAFPLLMAAFLIFKAGLRKRPCKLARFGVQ